MKNIVINEKEYSIEFTNISFTKTGLTSVVIVRKYGEVIDGARINLLDDTELNIREDIRDMVKEAAKKAVTKVLSVPRPQRLRKRKNTEPVWLIENLILKSSINLICAPGGVGKSLFALFTAMVVENGIPFFANQTRGKTLYLDWEVDYVEASRRATKIANYLKSLKRSIRYPEYMLMTSPLSESIGRILQIAPAYDYVIIDSAAPAAGGDVSDSSAAISFFDCVRNIVAYGTTVLIISHVSKADITNPGAAPIGSIYYENMPRIVWRVLGAHAHNELTLILTCRKSNVMRPKPFVVTMDFTKDEIRFLNYTNSQLCMVMTQLIYYLERGEKSVKEILADMGYDATVLTEAIDRLQRSGAVSGEAGKLRLSF